MKRTLAMIICGLCLVAVSSLAQEAEKPWFDLENCAFCKHLMAEEGLIDHMHPEYHNLKTGLLWITVVDKEYNDAFKRAGVKMEEVGIQMQTTGEIPYMCGFCSAYGEILMAGVNAECVETDAAHICLLQSDKPEVVEKLHAFGTKSAEELAKLRAWKTTE